MALLVGAFYKGNDKLKTNQESIIETLENALENAKNGEYDKLIIFLRREDSKDTSAAWVDVNTYDAGGMIMQGLQTMLSHKSSKEDSEAKVSV